MAASPAPGRHQHFRPGGFAHSPIRHHPRERVQTMNIVKAKKALRGEMPGAPVSHPLRRQRSVFSTARFQGGVQGPAAWSGARLSNSMVAPVFDFDCDW